MCCNSFSLLTAELLQQPYPEKYGGQSASENIRYDGQGHEIPKHYEPKYVGYNKSEYLGYDRAKYEGYDKSGHYEPQHAVHNTLGYRGYNKAGYEGYDRPVYYEPKYEAHNKSAYEDTKKYDKDIIYKGSSITKHEESKLY